MLNKIRLKAVSIIFIVTLLSACGGSGSGGNNTPPKDTAPIGDVSGRWIITETDKRSNCIIAPFLEPAFMLTVVQNANQLSVNDTEGNSFFGSISSNRVTWSGSYNDDAPDGTSGRTNLNPMSATIQSSCNNLQGSASWSWTATDGSGYSCTGTTDFSGVRSIASGCGRAPDSVNNLQAVANSESAIALSWQDNADNEDGFRIFRSLNQNSAFTQIDSVGADVIVYTDSSLLSATTYYYYVVAYNAAGQSNPSQTVNASTLGLPSVNPPSIPGGFMSSASDTTTITLIWNDVATETGYRIERATVNGGVYTPVSSLSVNVTSFSDTGLNSNTTYYYRLVAFNNAGDSGDATTFASTTASSVLVPVAPTNLIRSSNTSSSITLTWDDNADNETGFVIERSNTSDSGFSEIGRVVSNINTFTQTGLSAASLYWYRVAAYNNGGTSSYISRQLGTAMTAPALSAPATSGGSFNLNWTFSWPGLLATSQDRFVIEESTTSSTSGFATIATLYRSSLAAYSQSLNHSAGTYYYRIKAIEGSLRFGASDYSNVVAVAVNQSGSIPAAPTNLAFSHSNLSEVQLTWSNNASNATEIAILESTDGSNFTEIGSVAASQTAEPITDLRPCTQYWYRLLARNNYGDSSVSNTIVFSKNTTARITISNAGISPLLNSSGFIYTVGCFNNGSGGIGLYDSNLNGLLDNEPAANTSYLFPREAVSAGQLSSDWVLQYGKRYAAGANLVLLTNFSTWVSVNRPQFVAVYFNVSGGAVSSISMRGGDYDTSAADAFGTVRGVVMQSISAPGFSVSGDLPSANNSGVLRGTTSANIFFVTPALPGETQTTYGATVYMEFNMSVYAE